MKILLYGRSVWFGGLEAYLRDVEELDVLQADPLGPEAQAKPTDADLVILDSAQNHDALALLDIYPAAVIMSVNLITGALTIVSGQLREVQTMQDIVRLVREVVEVRPGPHLDLSAKQGASHA